MEIIKKYPSYKDSGVEWIGQIPEHWNLIKLKRSFKIMNGKEIRNEIDINDSEGINVFGSGGVFKKTNQFLYNGQSVLFGRKGTIGKPLYVDGKFWTVDTMYYTKFHKGMQPKWFYYMFNVFPWDLYTTKTALPSIVGTDIENEFWAVPDLREQQEIVKLLDNKTTEIDLLITDKEKLITLLEEKRQAIISEAVTKGLNPDVKMKDSGVDWIGEIPEHWDLIKLKRCLKVMNGREIQSEVGVDDPGGVNVFGSGGVFKKTDNFLYNGQSVLFGRKGTIGKPIYVEGEFWTVDTMYFTKFYQGMLPKWFYYMFNVFPWNLHVTKTALPSIVGTDIENEFWAVPHLNEQKQIVELLESKTTKISEIIIEIKQQINNLKEYRQSLIYEAVTGKIDVREYNQVSS
ncbi:restriction endonuclease subunit S [Terribacillus halophilus]|uniref:restriction endonuclease subunit S n=1 Tax=Terribacillus halophilus TaxID=361279 RepID=UPI000985B659|nr:restriction endonuclease subunit S [Terribacillus halophilus]